MDVRDEVPLQDLPRTYTRSCRKRKQNSQSSIEEPKPVNVMFPVKEKSDLKELRRNLQDPTFFQELDKRKEKCSTNIEEDVVFLCHDGGREEMFVGHQLKNYLEQSKRHNAKRQLVPTATKTKIQTRSQHLSLKAVPDQDTNIVDPKLLKKIEETHGQSTSQSHETATQPLTQPSEGITSTVVLCSPTQTPDQTQILTNTTQPSSQFPTQPLGDSTPKESANNQPEMQHHQTDQTTQQPTSKASPLKCVQQPEEKQTGVISKKKRKKSQPQPLQPRKKERQIEIGESSKIPKKEVAGQKSKKAQQNQTYISRFTAAKFQGVVKKLTDQQKKEVQEMGFGPLLDLDFPQYDTQFTETMVHSFDINRCSFWLDGRREDLRLTQEDVHCVYGLPTGGVPIEEMKNESQLHHLPNPSPTMKELEQQLLRAQDHPPGEHFKINFLVFAVNCLIKSTTSSKKVNTNFMKSVHSVDNINELNWSQYVIDSLISSIQEKRGEKSSSYFTGPVPFMMLAYFDRVRLQSKIQPRKFPILSCWTKKMINNRLNTEKKEGFGKGVIIGRIALDTQRDAKNQQHVEEEGKIKDEKPLLPQQETPVLQQQEATTSSAVVNDKEGTLKDFIEQFSKLLKDMGSNFQRFGTLLERARQIFPSNEINIVMGNVMSELWNKWANKVKLSQETQNEEVPVVSSEDDDFFNSDAVIETMKKFEKEATDTFQGKKVVGANIEPPRFSLGLGSSQPSQHSPSVDFVHSRLGIGNFEA